MVGLEKNCRALYEQAFGASARFDDALFSLVMPQYLRVIATGDTPKTMLFSIPYTLISENGPTEARYVYAVATSPAFRGKGLATQLLRTLIAEGVPLFLRPMSPELFGFYRSVGLVPVSPVKTLQGAADDGDERLPFQALSPDAYLTARTAYLTPPYTAPTAAFLSLGFLGGGALCLPERFVTFYEMHGERVLFKEWLGDIAYASHAAAFLGACTYELRTPDASGTPFGMAANCPEGMTFLIALD